MTELAASGGLGVPAIVGAVLVGGESRRMGRDKARLELGGRSLAERAAGVLEAVFAEVVLAARDARGWRDSGRRVVADRQPRQGPLGGIHSALDAASGRAVFALACDLPRVSSELVRHILEHAPAPSAGDEAWVALPRLGNRPQPLCGLWSAGCLLPLGQYLDGGGRRVLDFLLEVRSVEVPVGADDACYRTDLLDNVNTPDDLERLLEAAEAGAR